MTDLEIIKLIDDEIEIDKGMIKTYESLDADFLIKKYQNEINSYIALKAKIVAKMMIELEEQNKYYGGIDD